MRINETRTGCANCLYYYNGYCSYGNVCGGLSHIIYTSSNRTVTVPMDYKTSNKTEERK